jgi:hypothetical protein
VLAVHQRKQVLAFNRAAEPGTSPARGTDQRGEGGGMNTGHYSYVPFPYCEDNSREDKG